MYAQVEPPKENKSRAVANTVTQKKSNVKQCLGFVVNRPEGILQKKIQLQASDSFTQFPPKNGINVGFSNNHRAIPMRCGISQPIQRVVLCDVNMDELKYKIEQCAYTMAYDIGQEIEIGKSTKYLQKILREERFGLLTAGKHMPLQQDEVIYVVGHGGADQFTSIGNVGKFIDCLNAWGMTKGTQVVFAGCNTALARTYIDAVQQITGIPPIVNKDMAFTTSTREHGVPDSPESTKLHSAQKKDYIRLDFQYVSTLADALGLFFQELKESDPIAYIKYAQKFINKKFPTPNPKKINVLIQTLDMLVLQHTKELKGVTRIEKVINGVNEIVAAILSAAQEEEKIYLSQFVNGSPPIEYSKNPNMKFARIASFVVEHFNATIASIRTLVDKYSEEFSQLPGAYDIDYLAMVSDQRRINVART